MKLARPCAAPYAGLLAPAVLTLAACCAVGCHVSSDKNGKGEKVEFGSPFGNMQIKTNDSVDKDAIGIATYPGSTAWKDAGDGDKDKDSADINMSFGDFKLGVRAAALRTDDSPDKVLAFYKKDLARYGEVLTCRNDAPVGEPTRTSSGLTCNDNDTQHNSINSSDLELRAGSPQHMHIVGVEKKDGATKIGLVALDLPTHLTRHGDSDKQ